MNFSTRAVSYSLKLSLWLSLSSIFSWWIFPVLSETFHASLHAGLSFSCRACLTTNRWSLNIPQSFLVSVTSLTFFWILVRNFCWGKFRDGTKFEASRSAPANEHSNGNSETSSVQWTLQWRSSTLAFFPHSTSPATGGPSGKRLGTTWCHAGLMWKSKILPKKVAQGKHENTAALYTVVVFEQVHTHLLSWRVAVVGEWPAEVLCLVRLHCCTK